MEPTDALDLRAGVLLQDIPAGGMLPGKVDGAEAMLVRTGDDVFAVGARCTHYQANLCDGLLTGHVVRCPMHHSQFDIRTGMERHVDRSFEEIDAELDGALAMTFPASDPIAVDRSID